MTYTARLLGNPELLIDGAAYIFPFKKALVLALMLIDEGGMSRDRICEYLWGDKPVEKGKRNLSNAISYVRKVLPVDIGGGTISLSSGFRVERDIDKLKMIQSLSWNEISHLALPFMNSTDIEDLANFANWLMPKRQMYHAMFIDGLKERAQKSLMSEPEPNYEDAVRCYECICEHEPYDEKDHGELVRLYIRTNQKIKAVRTAKDFARRIEADLGINADLSEVASLMKRKSVEGSHNPPASPVENDVRKDDVEQHKEDNSSFRNIFLPVIEQLDEESRTFLDAVALVHEPAPMLHIAKILDISPLSVSSLYNKVHRQGFLREQCGADGEIYYCFAHAEIREALLSTMSCSRKAAIHLRCVEVLEAMHIGNLYRHRNICVRLFHHCHEAGLADRELFWRIRELALHFCAVHEVFPTMVDQDLMYYTPSAEDIDYTEKALAEALALLDKLMRKNGGTQELLNAERDLYILKGACLWWSAQYDDSRQILSDAIHKSIITGSPESAARACVQMCYLAIQTDNGEMLSQCASQLNIITRKAHLHQWLGISFRFLAISRILTGRYSEVERLLQMSTKVFEKLEEGGERYSGCIMAAEHFRGDLRLATGNIDGALKFYLNCIDIGESMGLYRGLGLSFAKAAFCMMLSGDYDKAEEYLLRAENLNIIMHSGTEKGLQGGGISFSLIGLIYCRKGDWKNGGLYLSMAEKLAKSARRPTWQAILYWAKSRLYEFADDMPEDFAQAVLTQSREWYDKQLRNMQHKVGWRI